MSQPAEFSPETDDLNAWKVVSVQLQSARRPMVSTKFGPESAVLLHMVTNLLPDIPVVWVDTGYNTRATLLFAEHLTEQMSLNLSVWKPKSSHVYRSPPAIDEPDHTQFTEEVKLEPFRRALAVHRPDIWFSGLRREQTSHRSNLEMLEEHAKGYRKVYPLLDWSASDVERYLEYHHLASETDYYDPTKGIAHRECGLHLMY